MKRRMELEGDNAVKLAKQDIIALVDCNDGLTVEQLPAAEGASSPKTEDLIEQNKQLKRQIELRIETQQLLSGRIKAQLQQIKKLEDRIRDEDLRQPSLPCSPSLFSNQSSYIRKEYVKTAPLYFHWFAVELYNQYNKAAKNVSGDITINLCDVSYKVSSESLDAMSKVFSTLSKIEAISSHAYGIERGVMGNKVLGASGILATTYFARELDRFLFPDGTTGACYHQFPVHRVDEKCDIYVTKLEPERLDDNPVLVGVGKVNDMKAAKLEAIAYCSRTHNYVDLKSGLDIKFWYTNLGLAFTRSGAELFLVVGDNGYVDVIEICSTDKCSRAFFNVLFAAVHYAINNLGASTTPGMVPLKECIADIHTNRRVFQLNDRVYKLFDRQLECDESPNFEIISSIDEHYLPGMAVSCWTEDERVMCLEYQYIQGDHEPKHLGQFQKLFCDLKKLHEKGYVHGDIKPDNLVFGEKEDEAWLIDFDLAGEGDGSRYPETYNYSLPCRHEHAIPLHILRTKHDTHSLEFILHQFNPSVTVTDYILSDK